MGNNFIPRNGIFKRTTTISSSSSPTPNADTDDIFSISALAGDATFGAPTGTPSPNQTIIFIIKDNGTARNLSFNAIYRVGEIGFPTSTTLGKVLYLGFIYNATDNKWDLITKVNNF